MTTTQSGPRDIHSLYDHINKDFRFEPHGNSSVSYVRTFAILTDGHDIIVSLDEENENEIKLGFEMDIPCPNQIFFRPSPYNFRRALEEGIYKGIVDIFPDIVTKRQDKVMSPIFKDKVVFDSYSFLPDVISISPAFSAIYGAERKIIHLPCLVKFCNAGNIAMPFSEEETLISAIPYWEIPELQIVEPDEELDSINKIIFAMLMDGQISIPDKDDLNLWEYP